MFKNLNANVHSDYASLQIIIANTDPASEHHGALIDYWRYISQESQADDEVEHKKQLAKLTKFTQSMVVEFNLLIEKIEHQPDLEIKLRQVMLGLNKNANKLALNELASWTRVLLKTEPCNTGVLHFIAGLKKLQVVSKKQVTVEIPRKKRFNTSMGKIAPTVYKRDMLFPLSQFPDKIDKFLQLEGRHNMTRKFLQEYHAFRALLQPTTWDKIVDGIFNLFKPLCEFLGITRKPLLWRKTDEELDEICGSANRLAFYKQEFEDIKKGSEIQKDKSSLLKPLRTLTVLTLQPVPSQQKSSVNIDSRIQKLATVMKLSHFRKPRPAVTYRQHGILKQPQELPQRPSHPRCRLR